MLDPNECFICGRSLSVGGVRTCESAHCRHSYQSHLEQGKPTCGVCGRPLWGSAGFGLPNTCGRPACHVRQSRLSSPGSPSCSVCGIALAAERYLLGTCGDRDCALVHERLQSRERMRLQQQRREEIEQEATVLRAKCASSSAGDAQNAPVSIIPHTQAKIGCSEPQRTKQLQEHVELLVQQAVCQRPDPSDIPCDMSDYHDEPSENEDVVFHNGCRMCQGHCCVAGRTHAFLSISTIRRVASEKPQLTPMQIVDEYVERIPQKSVVGSCVFHGEMGCVLPRGMRADMCNRFLCRDLLDIRRTLAEEKPKELFMVAVSEDGIEKAEFLSVPSST